MLDARELSTVSKSLLMLQRGLTGDRALAGAGYMQDSSFLGAYLLYYWCISYLQISYASRSVLADILALAGSRRENGTPLRILDVGSGPAPASAALCDILLGEKSGGVIPEIELSLADSSAKALSIAGRLFAADFPSVKVHSGTVDFEHKDVPVSGLQDIIVMSHALNELWKDSPDCISRRAQFIQALCRNLSLDGLLILCEPALLHTSRNLIALRDVLLREGFYLRSPCTADCKCPALSAGENQTCHAEIKWQPVDMVAALAKAAHLDRESVKMTYFIFSRSPAEKHDGLFRIVSDGMLNKAGRMRYLLCDGQRRIALSAKKDDAQAAKTGFFSLARYDSIMLERPQLRGDKENPAFGIDAQTCLKIQRFAY